MKSNRFVYLAVTNDIYELPIAIFENIKEIAEFLKTSYDSACCMVTRHNVNRKHNCKFIKVDINENKTQ